MAKEQFSAKLPHYKAMIQYKKDLDADDSKRNYFTSFKGDKGFAEGTDGIRDTIGSTTIRPVGRMSVNDVTKWFCHPYQEYIAINLSNYDKNKKPILQDKRDNNNPKKPYCAVLYLTGREISYHKVSTASTDPTSKKTTVSVFEENLKIVYDLFKNGTSPQMIG